MWQWITMGVTALIAVGAIALWRGERGRGVALSDTIDLLEQKVRLMEEQLRFLDNKRKEEVIAYEELQKKQEKLEEAIRSCLMLTVMIFLTSCVTTPPPEVIVQTYRPSFSLPNPPQYPQTMDWQRGEDDRYSLSRENFERLIEWRMRVESYYEQIDIVWKLIE